MKTVEAARGEILSAIRPMSAVDESLSDALGQVTAEAVVSPVDSPRFDNSAMDGYAVQWADVSGATEEAPVGLEVACEIAAGDSPSVGVGAGQAARIMTGAQMPPGADTVVMREHTDNGRETVSIRVAPSKGYGANVRRAGTYFNQGGTLVESGALVDSGTIGLLASIGRCRLRVRRRPRVAIVSTGDELVPLGSTPGPGQIVNSSAYMMKALVSSSGGEPVVMPIARDTFEDCRDRFTEALASADMVMSIGGVSVGDYDVVRQVIAELAPDTGFWKVQMKPGKPLAFGMRRGKPIFGLPGNPVSSYVCFYQFVWPALQQARGLKVTRLPRVEARSTAAMRGPVGRTDFQRGRLEAADGGWLFHPFSDQGSGNLTSVVSPGGLAVLPIGVSQVGVGDPVTVELLPRPGGG